MLVWLSISGLSHILLKTNIANRCSPVKIYRQLDIGSRINNKQTNKQTFNSVDFAILLIMIQHPIFFYVRVFLDFLVQVFFLVLLVLVSCLHVLSVVW